MLAPTTSPSAAGSAARLWPGPGRRVCRQCRRGTRGTSRQRAGEADLLLFDERVIPWPRQSNNRKCTFSRPKKVREIAISLAAIFLSVRCWEDDSIKKFSLPPTPTAQQPCPLFLRPALPGVHGGSRHVGREGGGGRRRLLRRGRRRGRGTGRTTGPAHVSSRSI